jgi:hypothetical protein
VHGALCNFLNVNENRIKNVTCTEKNGQTEIKFLLFDSLNQIPNRVLLDDLRDIIDNKKFIIIDNYIHITCLAVVGSLNYGNLSLFIKLVNGY